MVLLRGRRGFVILLWCVTPVSFDRVRFGLCKKQPATAWWYMRGARDVVLRRGCRGCFVSVLCVTSAPSDRVRRSEPADESRAKNQ